MDEVNSSVPASVKGVAYTNNRIWDTAEDTIPMQYLFTKAICSSDKSCEKGSVDIHSHGIQTGRCVNYNATVKTCEVRAWSPVESMENPTEPAVLRSSEGFTVLIKNNIHFPKFNYTTENIPPNLNTSCTYNKITSPLCPIFCLGDILQEAKENFSEVVVKVIIAIEINWDCNVDSWFYNCIPKHGFRHLDDKKIKPRFHFRYYKLPHGKEQRTLFKAYGIQFDVLIFSTVVSAIEIAICVGNCSSCGKSPFYKIYNRKKYEIVLNPREVMSVSYVDKPHILTEKPLKTSLQHARGSIAESHRVKFCDAGSCCSSTSNENHDNEESKPMHTCCCCGKCQPMQKYHEQLCCRRKKGQCITTSHWFQQLVLPSHTLKKALLYKDPFLDLTDDNINN
ncbi:LOW QUALITY PROTEIN: P2X purinoceptor 7-like [Morus bassanus]